MLVLLHHVLITQPDVCNYEWSNSTISAHGVLFVPLLRLAWTRQEPAFSFFMRSGDVLCSLEARASVRASTVAQPQQESLIALEAMML